MSERTIKARRWYWTRSVAGVSPERVRVTGWQVVNGERWCRIRHEGERVSTMLLHPSRLESEAAR